MKTSMHLGKIEILSDATLGNMTPDTTLMKGVLFNCFNREFVIRLCEGFRPYKEGGLPEI